MSYTVPSLNNGCQKLSTATTRKVIRRYNSWIRNLIEIEPGSFHAFIIILSLQRPWDEIEIEQLPKPWQESICDSIKQIWMKIPRSAETFVCSSRRLLGSEASLLGRNPPLLQPFGISASWCLFLLSRIWLCDCCLCLIIIIIRVRPFSPPPSSLQG